MVSRTRFIAAGANGTAKAAASRLIEEMIDEYNRRLSVAIPVSCSLALRGLCRDAPSRNACAALASAMDDHGVFDRPGRVCRYIARRVGRRIEEHSLCTRRVSGS